MAGRGQEARLGRIGLGQRAVQRVQPAALGLGAALALLGLLAVPALALELVLDLQRQAAGARAAAHQLLVHLEGPSLVTQRRSQITHRFTGLAGSLQQAQQLGRHAGRVGAVLRVGQPGLGQAARLVGVASGQPRVHLHRRPAQPAVAAQAAQWHAAVQPGLRLRPVAGLQVHVGVDHAALLGGTRVHARLVSLQALHQGQPFGAAAQRHQRVQAVQRRQCPGIEGAALFGQRQGLRAQRLGLFQVVAIDLCAAQQAQRQCQRSRVARLAGGGHGVITGTQCVIALALRVMQQGALLVVAQPFPGAALRARHGGTARQQRPGLGVAAFPGGHLGLQVPHGGGQRGVAGAHGQLVGALQRLRSTFGVTAKAQAPGYLHPAVPDEGAARHTAIDDGRAQRHQPGRVTVVLRPGLVGQHRHRVSGPGGGGFGGLSGWAHGRAMLSPAPDGQDRRRRRPEAANSASPASASEAGSGTADEAEPGPDGM